MKYLFIVGVLCLFLVAGCQQKQIVGGDKDAHGCIPSAGYSWCEAKQKCLRSWEEPCEISDEITDFERCIAEGNPAMESYPEQCSDGVNVYTEKIEMFDEFCESAGGNWNECSNKCQLAAQGKEGVACTLQCEALCECGGIAGFRCPQEYDCIIESDVVDALGYCR